MIYQLFPGSTKNQQGVPGRRALAAPGPDRHGSRVAAHFAVAVQQEMH
jgi:hypothetical protein